MTPIAIVGRACVLPGALSPEAFWTRLLAGDDLTSSAPAGRWGLDPDLALTSDPKQSGDRAWSDRGGYVTGFEGVFDPTGFAIPSADVSALDPLAQWVLHTGREALRDARFSGDAARVGAVLGNLSFPSGGMADYAARVWADQADPTLAARLGLDSANPTNRFMSGLPAQLLANGLGLGAGAFALDAACASGLYALALACERLADGQADWMLAAAVNRADDLFLHVGFAALQALSKTGQSRPFHAEADGLLPCEGCVVLVLRRLEEAERDGDKILGVIRGVGLSNDGRSGGFLAPNAEGQARALRSAWASAGRDPSTVGLIECHATGTSVGDKVELTSMAEVFGGASDVPIGSVKSNLGHPVTAAGLVAMLKVLGALEHGVRPPTRAVNKQNEALRAPFRLVTAPEPWTGPRIAGVSAFGFGGNNAHVVVEAYDPTVAPNAAAAAPVRATVAIVSIGARVAGGANVADFASVVRDGVDRRGPNGGVTASVKVSLDGLRFPPRDLEQTLAQQTTVLEAAREAFSRVAPVARERLGVFVGMGADAEVCRYGVRWRLAQWARRLGGVDDLAGARDAVVPLLQSAGVIGTMPNIPANRVAAHLDAAGPGFTVSSEELSGLDALRIAARRVAVGDLDLAIVGAVDSACEPVTQAALRALGRATIPGDAAVAIVIKRLDDARRDGDTVYAVLDDAADGLAVGRGSTSISNLVGRAHAAHALVEIAAAALSVGCGWRPGEKASPWSDATRAVTVTVDALGGRVDALTLRADGAPLAAPTAPAAPARAIDLLGHPAPVRLPSFATARGAMMSTNSDGAFVLPRPPVLPSVTGVSVAPVAPSRALAPVAPSRTLAPPAPATLASPAASPAAYVAPAALAVPSAPLAPSAPQHVGTSAPSPAAVAGPAFARPSGARPGLSPVAVAALAAETRRLAETHAAWVASQQSVHERFLAVRAAQAELLNSRRMQGGVAPRQAVPFTARTATVAAPAPAVAPPALMVQVPTAASVAAPVIAPASPVASPAPADVIGRPLLPSMAAKVAGRLPLVPAAELPGLKIDRKGLEVCASGKLSAIFGPLFERQDGYHRQVRMPEPPLLLADRVIGIDAEPGVLGKGTVWTETDLTQDAWYLHQGRMPAGVMIEAGQADLLLISYMGIDFFNQSDRVYRLLGCTLTYRDALPRVGDTLRYDIHVDGHAAHDAVRLFFFHYDCVDQNNRPRLEVRGGQAGFFTDAELDDSDGILWSPETGEHDATARLDAPKVVGSKRSFNADDILAFAKGDVFGCFGSGFELGKTHTDTPRIAPPPMLFFHEVTDLDPAGGPWKRGYLKARWAVSPDDWFFQGHFKNDHCMPGTLMFEGCLQALGFYLTSLGYTLKRDGWRFEPVPDSPIPMRCRGQVKPTARELTYEIFVEEVHDGPVPTIYADLLCTVDGLKAFHARRCGLRLNPAWPLDHLAGKLLDGVVDPEPVASADGFRFDYRSMLACAWGRPSEAFGPMYARFDGPMAVPRLPGPPYHFVTRATKIDGPIGGMKVGTRVSIDYDIPEDSWYFDANGAETMPFAVLLEAALQPCGWLASYVGSATTVEEELFFRNLDGTGTLKAELTRRAGTMRTDVTITGIAKSAGMIIQNFVVSCFLGDVEVYSMTTVFGFFPGEALATQKGLSVSPEQRARLTDKAPVHVDLTKHPERDFTGTLRLPDARLCMIDRIDYWPGAGKAGLGRGRSAKDVDPDEWFFKAHFFQDPVQPGSLGIEAMIQVLQWMMIEQGLDAGIESPRFEPLSLNDAMTWKYRGQVVPRNKLIQVDLEITSVRREDGAVVAVAEASLWVDGLRIYEAKNLGMRIVSGAPPDSRGDATDPIGPRVETLTIEGEPWLADHAPTWTVPVVPLGSMVDRLAGAGARPGQLVVALEGVQVRRWVPVGPEGTRVRTVVLSTDAQRSSVSLLTDGNEAAACTGTVRVAEAYATAPEALPPVEGEVQPDPYASGHLFHGPAFHFVTRFVLGPNGSSIELDLDRGSVPQGVLGQGLLDAMTHGIPHDRMNLWHKEIGADVVGYPLSYERIELFGPIPARGRLRVEARPDGLVGARLPATRIQVIGDSGVLLQARLVEIMMPKGPVGSIAAHLRPRFLHDLEFIPGVGLSRREGDDTVLRITDLAASDWLPGTVRQAFGSVDPIELAMRDHAAAALSVHPRHMVVQGNVVTSSHAPLNRVVVEAQPSSDGVRVRGLPQLDLTPIETYWRDWFGVGPWPVEDIYFSLIERFIRGVVIDDPAAFEALRGRPVLFLGNHQTMIESLLLSVIVSGLTQVPTVTIAKKEHRISWLGRLIAHCFSHPAVRDPKVITFFDRDDKDSMPTIISELSAEMRAGKRSTMVHVEGTRSFECRTPVIKMSGTFLDMAVEVGCAVVPMRFTGGLPVDRLAKRVEFPAGYGQQTIHFGKPLLAAELKAMPLKVRKDAVLDGINGISPRADVEEPWPGDPAFAETVAEHVKRFGVETEHAVLAQTLIQSTRRGSDVTTRVVDAIAKGTLTIGEGPVEAWIGELGARMMGAGRVKSA